MDGPRGGSITLGHLRFEPYTGPISVEKLNPLRLESGEDLRQGLLARGGGAPLEICNRLLVILQCRTSSSCAQLRRARAARHCAGLRVINPLSTLLMWTREARFATLLV